ncbi:MAG: hypothetical protein B7X79_08715 [Acidovorax sp. 17-64-282]|nr:MAG: hypothetical protein B7Z11_04540 [Acidovorax sp. 32-64-7]OYY86157.1 MAG: hypothetical protein B7Y46_06530 [Acidovorax sp. 28-64-14]OZA56941.1 MAG: hypothetical protein B7X79_08715 [Acidovorax sp. 17-64-282]
MGHASALEKLQPVGASLAADLVPTMVVFSEEAVCLLASGQGRCCGDRPAAEQGGARTIR